MSGKAGSTIGIVGVQPPIGSYKQDALEPTANTNFIGFSSTKAWDTNVLSEDNVTGSTCPNTYKVATSLASWVKAGITIVEGATCAIAAGVAGAGATHVCKVKGGVVANQYFWAVLV